MLLQLRRLIYKREESKLSFVDLIASTSLSTYTRSLWHLSENFERMVLNLSSKIPVCMCVYVL